MPEYTLSLLIWILPIIFFELFFFKNKLLSKNKRKALTVTVSILAAVGILLDLFFANKFFTFPIPSMTLGYEIRKIPIEEFIFYITGFWFIIYLYIFLDEWYLKLYNPPDEKYVRYRKKLSRKLIFIHTRAIYWGVSVILLGIILKKFINPTSPVIPGYFIFLLLLAYIPFILFYRVTKRYVNWRAFFFTLSITVLISIVWEVTLAIPRGYWGYQSNQMLGIFLPAWGSPLSQFPIEAVSVWMFCTLVIMVFEFLKINFFIKN